MSLEQQIQDASKQIATDSYSMSVGEFISLYKDGEVDIHPDFQRFFRWTDFQKSRFIESLLLGLPVPPLFVAQNEGSKWDLVDGLQRVSTILQLVGELQRRDGTTEQPLTLLATRYIPQLKGKVWNAPPDQPEKELPSEVKLRIRRARLDIKIVLSKSDPDSKFELFDRLNTGGSVATEQEVRNCMLLMANRDFFEQFQQLDALQDFKNCMPLTEKQLSEQYDMELIARFIVLRNMDVAALSQMDDLHSVLTDGMLARAKSNTFDWTHERKIFSQTFNALSALKGEDVFRRFDINRNRNFGPFLLAAFEIFALGYAHNLEIGRVPATAEALAERYNHVWAAHGDRITSTGRRASSRLAETVALGREHLVAQQ
ncbi:DUF262 domain-containing protein [Burkholderia gladioli]|uniref:DUF262 domain-containing protein n=1 Tax=Burkholderia gladioli TaxID=28095 RepID=UPI001ABAFBDD|nr:DUF262 domain-containing protein [Burkholderia gladioli]